MKTKLLIVIAAAAAAIASLVACGQDGDVTGPSGSRIPSVSGRYSGSINLVFPEVGESLTCPASTTVTQSGANVSIAPAILGGQCGGVSIPVGDVTIDSNGSFGNASGSYYDSSCGAYTYTASGGFYGRDLRYSMTATSRTCWDFNFTAVLSR